MGSSLVRCIPAAKSIVWHVPKTQPPIPIPPNAGPRPRTQESSGWVGSVGAHLLQKAPCGMCLRHSPHKPPPPPPPKMAQSERWVGAARTCGWEMVVS